MTWPPVVVNSRDGMTGAREAMFVTQRNKKARLPPSSKGRAIFD